MTQPLFDRDGSGAKGRMSRIMVLCPWLCVSSSFSLRLVRLQSTAHRETPCPRLGIAQRGAVYWESIWILSSKSCCLVGIFLLPPVKPRFISMPCMLPAYSLFSFLHIIFIFVDIEGIWGRPFMIFICHWVIGHLNPPDWVPTAVECLICPTHYLAAKKGKPPALWGMAEMDLDCGILLDHNSDLL